MDPLRRFSELFELAKRTPAIADASAMTLSTVSADGKPSSRVVLLKGLDDGLVFYTNLRSRKGREIAARADVALLFYWPPLEMQVRFEGPAAQVSDAEADEYFATRPRGSQLGAWASDQSETLPDRAMLEARLAEVTARYQGKTVPRPPHWSGFRVMPLAVEFWKNRPDRLHERELFTRERPAADWKMRLLNP